MNNWRKIKLKDICVLNYGKSLVASKRVKGTIPVYSSAGITGFHNVATINSAGLIIGRKGTVGSVYKSEVPFCCIDTAYYILPNPKDFDLDFLFYRLKILGLHKLNEDSAVPGLNRDTAYNQEFYLPNLDDQKRIAAILGALDDKIELNNRINKKLEEQASALFKHWFVDFEFLDANGKPYKSSGGAFKDSELGLIPEGWSIEILSNIADITMGQSPIGESYNLNNEGEVFYQGRADFGNRFPTRRLFTTMPNRMAVENSVLMSVRAPVGDINIATERCCIGRGLASLNAYNNQNSYLLYLMHSLKGVLDKYNGEGTVFGSINKKSLENIPIMQPHDDLIQKFELIASKLDKQILCKFKESVALAQLRDALLPKLMNNEVLK